MKNTIPTKDFRNNERVSFKHILCPVDFSPASLRAFDYSIRLAQNYAARLHLLHVIPPVIRSAYDFAIDGEQLTATLKEHAVIELMNLRKVASGSSVDADFEIRIGEVEPEIRESVQDEATDLVVIGKHGRHGIDRWFMGSVTERLLRRLPVPMLIINEGKAQRGAPPNIRNIVLTTDFAEGAAKTVSFTLALAQQSQAIVTVLHVMPHTAGFELPYDKPKKEVQSQLSNLIPEHARSSGIVVTEIESGVPFKTILTFVENNLPDLLVMNIHGKGALERALLGSTAERVIRGAPCPVLAIPPQKSALPQRTPKRAA
jgi:nucleotide-binding universal stress UspA family protein